MNGLQASELYMRPYVCLIEYVEIAVIYLRKIPFPKFSYEADYACRNFLPRISPLNHLDCLLWLIKCRMWGRKCIDSWRLKLCCDSVFMLQCNMLLLKCSVTDGS